MIHRDIGPAASEHTSRLATQPATPSQACSGTRATAAAPTPRQLRTLVCQRRPLGLLVGLLFASLGFGLAAHGAPAAASTLTAAQRAAGWELLFDGHSTTAWRGFHRADFPRRGWVIRDGCLVHKRHGGGGDIITKSLFDNFDFRFEWRIGRGGNSGVKYFITEQRRGAIGHEYQILDDDRAPDAKNGPYHQTASFYDVLPPGPNKRLHPAGEWNSGRIIVRGNHVEHWLNGVRVLTYEMGSARVKAAIARSKFRHVKGFDTHFRAHILLQDHGGEVWFRNLKIRRLPPTSTDRP